jgi:hypothetical protein
MDGFGLQVSMKPGEPVLINVRGQTPGEFDLFWGHLLTKIPEIRRVSNELAAPAALTGIPLLERELGGRVVEEYDAPAPASVSAYAPQYPPQPAYQYPPATPVPAGPVATYCDRCKKAPTCSECGLPGLIPAKSVKGGQYYVHDCPSGQRGHKGQWCNLPGQ